MKSLKLSFMALVAVALTACATSFDQRLAVGYEMNTAVRVTAAAALDAQRIDSAQGENVLAITDNARKVLDTAATSKDKAALELALDILNTVEDFVR